MGVDLRVGMTIRAYDKVSSVVQGITSTVKGLESAATRSNNSVKATFAGMSAAIKTASESASKSWQKAGDTRNAAEGVNRVGKALRSTLMGTTDEFRQFDFTMTQIRANAENLSEGEFADITARAKQLGSTTKFGATEAAEGMLNLSKAGFSTAAVMQGIGPTLNLATAESLDLGRAAEISAGVMSTFGMKASELGLVGDVLSKTASVSTTDVGDLAESFKYAGGQANALKIGLADTGALFAALASSSIKGSQAGTALAGVLRGLEGAGKGSNKILNGLKIKTSDKNGLLELSTIFGDLNAKLKKYNTVDQAKILTKLFGAEAVPGAIAILNAASKTGEGSLASFTTAMRNSAGETNRKAIIMGGSAEMIDKRFTHSMQAVNLEVGKLTSEIIDPLKEKLGEVLSGIAEWVRMNPGLAKGIVGVTLAASGLATVMSGILFTATTLYATKGILTMMGGMKGATKIAAGPLKTALMGLTSPLKGTATAFFGANAGALAMLATLGIIVAACASVMLAFEELEKHWEELDVMEGFKGMWDQAKESFVGSGGGTIQAAGSVAADLFNPMTLMKEKGMITDDPKPYRSVKEDSAGFGELRIKIDAEGNVTSTQTKTSGALQLSVDGGL